MLLTIGLSTIDITTNLVKNAMETISFAEVKAWLDKVFGQSLLCKRRALFAAALDDIETALTFARKKGTKSTA
jgi:hypothetical protein